MVIKWKEFGAAHINKPIVVEVIVPHILGIDLAIRWGWVGFDIYQTMGWYTILLGFADLSVSKNG